MIYLGYLCSHPEPVVARVEKRARKGISRVGTAGEFDITLNLGKDASQPGGVYFRSAEIVNVDFATNKAGVPPWGAGGKCDAQFVEILMHAHLK